MLYFVTMMNGQISDIRLLPVEEQQGKLGPPLDLVDMARKSIHYLESNPDPEHQYQCRFNYFLLRNPPFDPSALLWGFDVADISERDKIIDPVAIADTESRNDISFAQMWEMTGAREGANAHDIVHKRLESYIRSGEGKRGDDVCWAVPYCASSDIDAPCVSTWATGKLLQSAAILYGLTGNEHHRKIARRLFEGLYRLAAWDSGRAFYAHSQEALRDDGAYAHAYDGHYPSIIAPLLEYWQRCGDGDALDFAAAMAEGFLSDLQPDHLHRPDGRILGHNHVQMHAARGVAQLGALTGDWRSLEWAKAAYDFYWANAFDTGWMPEGVAEPEHSSHSETCLTADMLEMTVWFARAGRPRFWDRVERMLRNYFVPAQFELTAPLEKIWRDMHRDATPSALEEGIEQLRDREGGFISALTPNDRIFEVPEGQNHHGLAEYRGKRIVLDMMGCCPPEGMRALYLTWANTMTKSDDGVLVNLSLDHDGQLGTVLTEMPRRGVMKVTTKLNCNYYLRPPSWAPRERVRAWRNGSEIDVVWGGPAFDYVLFLDARPKDELTIQWPLVSCSQNIVARRIDRESERTVDMATYNYRWVGNTATAVEPKGKWLPLYVDE